MTFTYFVRHYLFSLIIIVICVYSVYIVIAVYFAALLAFAAC